MTKESNNCNLLTLPSGKLRYKLTNDYMFRAVFQKNENALKGLLSALLSIPKNEIKEVTILNPIILGETIDDKTCILDLHIRLNNNELINIEMQVEDLGNWPERSITYLGRSFDQVKSGGDYSDICTTIHIGILDFNLSHLTPEFYSEFKLMNAKNHEIYSDKFVLSVINLNQIELATEEDRKYGIDHWARLFKADTWEAIKKMAQENAYISDAAETLLQSNQDLKIRSYCEAVEEARRVRRGLERLVAEKDEALAEKDEALAEKDAEIARLKALLENK